LPRLAALQSEWRVHPPAHWLLAAALNYRPPAQSGGGPNRHASIAQLKAALPGGRL
jgi:hypothetical protein